jgi:hypothetical protein
MESYRTTAKARRLSTAAIDAGAIKKTAASPT